MDTEVLSDAEASALGKIGQFWVCASYWEDRTILRYRALGLVERTGKRIVLTDAGQRYLQRFNQAPP